jgi:hypothetical protein
MRRSDRACFSARKLHAIRKRDQRRVVREVLLPLPDGGEGTAQKRIGIMPRSSHRDDEPVGHLGVKRPEFRMQIELQPALLAPALQLEDAIA